MTYLDRIFRRLGAGPSLILTLLALIAGLSGCSSDDDLTAVEQLAYRYVVQTHAIGSWDYLNNRFFRLDLPPQDPSAAAWVYGTDDPGRPADLLIDPWSIQVYLRNDPVPVGKDFDVSIAAVIDSTGTWGYDGDHAAWFDAIATEDWALGTSWFLVDVDLLLDQNGRLVAVDLGRELAETEVLAVVYDVIDGSGAFQYRVGNRPGSETDALNISGMDYCAMKLLKPTDRDPFPFQYVLRNIYDLGERFIDYETFDFRIERVTGGNQPDLDDAAAGGFPFIRIFGLDRLDPQGSSHSDGVADFMDPRLFDLQRGLLKFPRDFPFPFAASEARYAAHVDDPAFLFANSYVARNLTPEIYDPQTSPAGYPDYAPFRLMATVGKWISTSPPTALGDVSLARPDWMKASAPVGLSADDRVEQIRWFLPRERSLRRYFNPTLGGTAGNESVTALELYLRSDAGPWSPGNWGGVMTSLSVPTPLGAAPADLTHSHYFEIWINDGRPYVNDRHGTLHIDFGYISEDGFWPLTELGEPITGTFEHEDGIVPGTDPDGIWNALTEDIGLAGLEEVPYLYDADYDYLGDPPFAGINGTARNDREDSEDINGDSLFNRDNGYFTLAIDLAADDPVIDVVYDFADQAPAAVQNLIADHIAWRLYQFRLNEALPVDEDLAPDLSSVTHLRLWYESDDPDTPPVTTLQIARMRFIAAEAKGAGAGF